MLPRLAELNAEPDKTSDRRDSEPIADAYQGGLRRLRPNLVRDLDELERYAAAALAQPAEHTACAVARAALGSECGCGINQSAVDEPLASGLK